MLSDKVEVVEGIVSWIAGEEVHTVSGGHPAYVSRHTCDGVFVTAVYRRRPCLVMAAHLSVKEQPGLVCRRLGGKLTASVSGQPNRTSAVCWHLPNGTGRFRGEIDALAIGRPKRIRSVWRRSRKSLGRPSFYAHHVEF